MAQVGLQVAPTPEAPGDLVVTELLVAPEVEGGPPARAGDGGEDQPRDRGNHAADHRGGEAGEHPQGHRDHAAHGQEHGEPGDGAVAWLGDRHLVVDRGRLLAQLGAQLPDLAIQDACPLHDLAQHRQRVRGRMTPLELGDLVGHHDGLAIPLEALLRHVALRDEALRLARLLQQGAPLREDVLRGGAALASSREGVPVALELGELGLALGQVRLRLGDGLLGDAQPPGVALAAGLQVPEGPVEAALRHARAPIGAADGRLQPVAQGSLVPGQVEDLVVAHRGRGPEELLARGSR